MAGIALFFSGSPNVAVTVEVIEAAKKQQSWWKMRYVQSKSRTAFIKRENITNEKEENTMFYAIT